MIFSFIEGWPAAGREGIFAESTEVGVCSLWAIGVSFRDALRVGDGGL
jgi:hypothetical protein